LVVGVMALALMAALARAERLRRGLGETPPPRPFWLAGLSTVAWIVLALSLLALLIGYAALGSFLVRQALWTLVVIATTYLASVLIDDGFTTLVGGPVKDEPPTLQTRLRGQAAVLLSGVGRLMAILVAAVLLLAPFGEAPADLLHRLDQLYKGLQIGEVQIRPGAVAQALLVLALALLSVRLLKRWLSTRYLPTTELDPGMQVSAATLFGYAGVVISVALALSALGIGLERVAWIASALSVGIGFGLQAVVQNFVSGLILLAERPVKVGDWVS
ncbi:mechanosensitive ion channel, partial [Bordetella hinzii]|nr:mechanosensitive ion channel [Bordetella hinzii]